MSSGEFISPDLMPAMPELILACGAMALLMLGVFRGDQSTRLVTLLSVGLMVVAGGFVLMQGETRVETFGGSFVIDAFSHFAKILILLGSSVILLMARDYQRRENMERFEFPILVLLATLGMLMMVSAKMATAMWILRWTTSQSSLPN